MLGNEFKRSVEIAFARLIGPLATITFLESYKESRDEYHELLQIIIRWSSNYMLNRELSKIDKDDLLKVYNQLENLKTRWLFSDNLGEESELSDEAVIWMWELMLLRKKEIEMKVKNSE